MSYDLEIWVTDIDAARPLLAGARFSATDGTYELGGQDWTILANIHPVDDDEIPDAIFSRIVGVTHRIDLMLTSSAPTGYSKVARLARSLAEKGRGAVEGLAPEPWLSRAAKAMRATPPPSTGGRRRVTDLALNWWFDPDASARPGMLEGLMFVINRHLPEALPKRYESVTPQHRFKLADTGMDHFVRYLRNEPTMALVDPQPPCLLASYPHGQGYGWQTWARGDTGYIPCRLEFGFDAAILNNSDWRQRLERAWREISRFVMPFYGDIRLLDGLSVDRGQVGVFMDADVHPATFAFWEGIPNEPALARVIGAPYLTRWPGLPPPSSGLVFLGSSDWALRDREPTEVPADLASFPLQGPERLVRRLGRLPALVLPFEDAPP